MELKDLGAKPEESRSMPFDIDLNETPLSSPRQPLAGNDVTSLLASARVPSEGCLGSVGFLDINALPPSEADGEGNFLYFGNRFDLRKVSGSVTGIVKTGFEDLVQQRLNFGRNLKDGDPSAVLRGRLWKGLHLHQRRNESLIISRVKNFKECQENLKSNFAREFSLGIETADAHTCKLKSNLGLMQPNSEETFGCASLEFKDGFPVQFEDFYILSLGEVDPRPSYHNTSQIWPLGYRSSWHDKLTGSLFVCDVTDGGDSGPVFKVKRYPCSTQPIPIGSTVLSWPSFDPHNGKDKVESDDTFGMDDDEDTNIQMIFLDHSPPHLESDILSSSGNDLNEACNSQKKLQTEPNCLTQCPGKPALDDVGLGDGIGEFSAEGRSSFLVWRMVSQTMAHACRKQYQQTGVCKFCCSHGTYRLWSSCFVPVSVEVTESSDSLAKFCYFSGPINIPHCIRSNIELDTSCKELVKWLEQDRFGLDVAFVQEIIEQLPGVDACTEYTLLNKRSDKSTLHTVDSGSLLAKRKSDMQGEKEPGSIFKGCKRPREQVIENPAMKNCCPPGKPLSSKLPTDLIGDVLQSWELLWRFSEVLGLEEPLSFKELEEELINGYTYIPRSSASAVPGENQHAFSTLDTESLREATHVGLASNTYSRCNGVALAKVHYSLLKVLLNEWQSKVATFVDPNFDTGEFNSRRRRKKNTDNWNCAKKTMLDLIPINELTWPELARRYILTVSSMEGNLDCIEIINHESFQVFHCLQGDHGTSCGSLLGVAGMEADAMLLAEATKQIFGSSRNKNDLLSLDCYDSHAPDACKTIKVNDSEIPEWAQVLEPVRKLPTNVGARIKKCVYDALERNPPEWAKKILEHSISKEVYKGNASGPTKKAVLSLLADVCSENQQQKPNRKRKNKCLNTVSDVIMKQCRKVLRHAVTADEDKVFCNLLGRTLLNTSDDDEGLIGFPAMVSRPLDFRTIDLRLAFGAYGGSHEAFVEDVREVWHQIHTAFGNQSDLIHLAETLSQNFEALYEKEVLTLARKLMDYASVECLNSEGKKDLEDIIDCVNEIPKAPWEEGVCKVCGVDKDDDNVLLCDTCDSEYHTFCLNPPLARIPEGNWYCPSCVTSCISQGASQVSQVISQCQKRRYQGEFTCRFFEALTHLATTMEIGEYWEYSLEERIFLLKFLCDEVLNSTNIREHLEQCASICADLKQKLCSVSLEWRNLKFREEILDGKVTRENTRVLNAGERSGTEGVAIEFTDSGKLMRQSLSGSSYFSSFSSDLVPLKDGLQWYGANDFSKQPCWLYSQGISGGHSCGRGSQIIRTLDGECLVNQESDKDNGHLVENLKNQLSLRIPQQQKYDSDGEYISWGNFNREQQLEKGGNNGSMLPTHEAPRGHVSSDTIRADMAEHVHDMLVNSENPFPSNHCSVQPNVNGPQAENIDVSYLKNEISVLQDSIVCLESQLVKVSLRKDFLGRDCAGRLYWAFSRLGMAPWLVVDGTTILEQKSMVREHGCPLANKSTRHSSPFKTGNFLSSRGLKFPILHAYKQIDEIPVSSSWFSYQSDDEIEELIGWLRDGDPSERELSKSILQWQKIASEGSNKGGDFVQDESKPTSSKPINSEITVNSGLVTKALTVLEKKHGPCLDPEATNVSMRQGSNRELTCKERMYRCECLEPIWPSRHHCCLCHLSFSTRHELDKHNNGMCNSRATASQYKKLNDDTLKRKGRMWTETSQGEGSDKMGKGVLGKVNPEIRFELIGFPNKSACPYDIEDISVKFVTKSSNKELVREMGLIGLKGTPSFVPSTSPYINDPALKLVPSCKTEVNHVDKPTNVENQLQQSVKGNMKTSRKHDNGSSSSKRSVTNGNYEEALKTERFYLNFMNEKRDHSPLKVRGPKLGVVNCSIIHDSSLRALVGRAVQILRRLKINLLDMDAALPQEALKPSKASLEKRCSWRAFVKSAKSIFEMVQATIVFENMIKTEFFRNGWWYWSSLRAAAKIATVSSLALRIYTLDSAIVYEKCGTISATKIPEFGSESDKTTLPYSDATNIVKLSRKPVLKTPKYRDDASLIL